MSTPRIDRTSHNAQEILSTFNDWKKQGGKFIPAVLAMVAEIFIDNLREETRKGNGPGYCYRVGWPDLNHGRHVVPHPWTAKRCSTPINSTFRAILPTAKSQTPLISEAKLDQALQLRDLRNKAP